MLIVKKCLTALPDASSVLCFDTLFHSTLPDFRYTYAISQPTHPTPVPLRRYGFHGLSFASILEQMAQKLGKKEEDVNLVVAHLGSGGSVCLIQGGKSANTSMGVTPLEGALLQNPQRDHAAKCLHSPSHYNFDLVVFRSPWWHAIWIDRCVSNLPPHEGLFKYSRMVWSTNF